MNGDNVIYTLYTTGTTDTTDYDGYYVDYQCNFVITYGNNGWAVIDVKKEKDEWKEVTDLLEGPL